MSDALLAALCRRFSSQAALLEGLLPALTSDDPTPFLARYRADVLQGMPEAAFRKLRQAAREERELARRRQGVRRLLEQAGALTDDVAKVVDETSDAALLEDVARPLRAAKAALGDGKPAEDPMRPVARSILAGEATEPLETLLAPFCGADGAPPTVADQRVRLVRLVADLIGDDAEARRSVRATARRSGELVTSLESRKETKPAYKPFADMRRAAAKVPARTLLLLRRGQKTGSVRVNLSIPDDERAALLAGPLEPREGHPSADLVREAATDALDRVLLPAAANELMKERKRAAERSLLPGFAQALREKLLTPPAGRVPVVAVVPGATGTCRIAVVDADGRPGATVAVHPLPPRNEKEEAAKAFVDLVRESGAKIVAVAASGRARALREWAVEVLAANRELGAVPVFMQESAAVAWSESEAGKTAEPEHPATVRAAHSLARCLQDPMAEALRYDLCEVPVGPNSGDVDQGELRRRLDETAEACVALVGADVNTAPAALLARVPGLDAASAAKIVAWRDANGPFATRADVRRVEGLDEQAWQRAAGFLRIRGGTDPLDATGVHPTGAMIVPAIAAKLGIEPAAVIGRADLLAPLDAKEFAGPVLTESDVKSVLAELANGTEDPRGSFVPPAFNPGVGRAKDLAADMEMDGIVTNVSKFGAFVDLGVGQDGLVHVSEMSHDYVRDPADVVQPGQKVRVKVLAVDSVKRRISLSIKALLPAPERPAAPPGEERPQWGARPEGGPPRGPRRPPRGRPDAAGEAGRPPGPRRDGRGERGPGGFMPERPGTAPRRAQGRGRFGRGKEAPKTEDGEVDLSRDSGTGSFRDLTGGRGGPRRFDRPERPAGPRRPDAPSGLDPFQQQLAALRAQLEGAKPEEEAPRAPQDRAPLADVPPTDPPADGDRPTA